MKKNITAALLAVLILSSAMPAYAKYYHSVAGGVTTAEKTVDEKNTELIQKFIAANSKQDIFSKYTEIRDTKTIYNNDGRELSSQFMSIYPNSVDDNLNADYEDSSKKTWSLTDYIKYQPKNEKNRAINYKTDVIYGGYNYQKVQDSIYYFHFFDLDKYDITIDSSGDNYTITAKYTANKDDYILKQYKEMLNIPSKYTALDTSVVFTVQKDSLEYTAFDIEVKGCGKIHTDCKYISKK